MKSVEFQDCTLVYICLCEKLSVDCDILFQFVSRLP